MRKKSWCPCVFLSACVCFVLTLVSIILPQTTQAAEYYLDAVNGDDSNPGTSEQPWKTIARAQNYKAGYIPVGYSPMVQPDDTVIVKDGNYGTFNENDVYNPRDKWYIFRTDWITYRAASGHSPILTGITIRNEDAWHTPKVNGNSYLIFDGFRITDAVSLSDTSYLVIKNCDITQLAEPYEGFYAPYFPRNSACVSVSSSHPISYFTLENNLIHHGGNGIIPELINSTIKNNTIYRFSADGIHWTGNTSTNCTIEGNRIYGPVVLKSTTIRIRGTRSGTFTVGDAITQAGTGATGFFESLYSSTGIYIYQTSETNFTIAGGTVTGPDGNVSSLNEVAHEHSDGISVQGPFSYATFKNNIIGGTITNGIKLAESGGMHDVNFVNNLIYGVSEAFSIEDAYNLNFYNNTIYDTGEGAQFRGGAYHDVTVLEMHNNIFSYLNIYNDAASKGHHNQVVNHSNNIFITHPNFVTGYTYPFTDNETEQINQTTVSLFVDAANGDFRFIASSPAINFGNATYAPATDILGNLRDALPDAGCYEYGASTFLYGDVSGEGEISAYDAALTAQAAVGLITLSPEQITAADVNGDSEISAYDAALIAQRAVGLIDKFPI